ncbi:MAG: Gfo/Idh/MocA family oxidoreductase [Anaerolineaceae bacterium]|nr:Gfo/Idh/MocA family oxidoreductase [Anaerolineaceae bacterium]
MTERLRVGLIGCGNVVSYGHAPAIQALPAVELVALADVTPARRQIGQQWFGLSDEDVYADHRALLARGDLEAVVVAVPQRYRRDIVLAAFAAGLHVLSEKPLADAPATAAEIVTAAESAGLQCAICHNYLFFPEYRALKEEITQRSIGELRVLTLNYLGVIDYPGAAEYEARWRHSLAAGGGVLMDMIHAVYLAQWLADDRANQVNAFVAAPEYSARLPEVEDLALLQVSFPHCYALINIAWGQGVGGVDISGSEGHLRLRYEKYQTSGFNQPAELYRVNDWQRREIPLANLPRHEDNVAAAFTALWADFHAAIRENRAPAAPARDGALALELALAGYLSAVTGQTITLPLSVEHPVYRQGIAGLTEMTPRLDSSAVTAGLFGFREVP